uniref:Uncharacterized protein n=1 Tax=Aegilops tauschii subsp. strangulata TaxID=200361 RepID=A0A453MUT3_AEGTS
MCIIVMSSFVFGIFFLTFRHVLMHSSGLVCLKCACACYILCSD